MFRVLVISVCLCRFYIWEGGGDFGENVFRRILRVEWCFELKIKEVVIILFIWKIFIKLFCREILILCFELNMFNCSLYVFVKIMI